MLSINPAETPIPKLHEHLLGAIAPRPIAFVTTVDKEGNVNLSPFSFFNVFGANPATLVYSPARSGRTGATKNTHDNVLEIAECVVNIAHYDILYQMNLAAGMYPKGVNEFAKSGLTAIPSVKVKPPRVAECYVQMECTVKQVIETGPGGGSGNLVICEVQVMHINENVLNEEGSIDPYKMNYIARMGKQFWCKVTPDSIISVPSFKMGNELGMGWDALPEGITKSKYLTGNQIAQVATLHEFPGNDVIEKKAAMREVQEINETYGAGFAEWEKQMHHHAGINIERGNMELGVAMLLMVEQKRKK
jgi:flavin reductase (DIM6/NTAB) family NADH-FMN oxidoreductase RutF